MSGVKGKFGIPTTVSFFKLHYSLTNNCLNTKNTFYIETSGVQNYHHPCLEAVYFVNITEN